MQFSVKEILTIVAIIFVFSQSEASVANLIADRTLAKLSERIKTNGSIWLTLPDTSPESSEMLPPADEMADKILAAMAELVRKHCSDWTHLPGTWKQYFDPNGTLIYYIGSGFGNFTSAGSMKRVDAAYINDNTYLNIIFETDSMSAIYGKVVYTSNWARYIMDETIKTKALKTSLSVSFSQQEGSESPTCYGGSVGIVVSYEGGDLDVENLTPGVPGDVQTLVKTQLSSDFLNDFIGAVEDLYTTVAMNAIAQVCPQPT